MASCEARRPGARGRRPQPGAAPAGGLRARDAAAAAPRAARRRPARRAAPAGRVRRVRAARLPDVHDRDLHRVPARLRRRVLRRALARARRALPAAAGREIGLRGRTARRLGRRRAQAPPRARSGCAPCRRCSALAALVALALGVPLGALVYWLVAAAPPRSRRPRSPARPSRLGLGLAAAAVTTLAAIPVAVLAVRYRRALARLLERSTYIARAMPGPGRRARARRTSPSATRSALYQSLAAARHRLRHALLPAGAGRDPRRAGAGLAAARGGRALARQPAARRLPARDAAADRARASPPRSRSSSSRPCTELTATLCCARRAPRRWRRSSGPTAPGLAYGAAAPYAALMIAISAVPDATCSCAGSTPWRRRARERASPSSGVAKSFGATPVLTGVDADGAHGRLRGRARPVGLRQDDAAAPARGLRPARRRRDRARRPRRSTTAARACPPQRGASATSRRRACCSRT